MIILTILANTINYAYSDLFYILNMITCFYSLKDLFHSARIDAN